MIWTSSRRVRGWLVSAGLAAALAAPTRAWAQTPRLELSLGWQHVSDVHITDGAQGWYGDLALNLRPWVGIVGEFTDASWDKVTAGPLGGGPSTVLLRSQLQTLMIGVRGSIRSHPRVVPFGQMFYGKSDYNFYSWPDAETSPAFQIGAGVNVKGAGPIGVRIAIDQRKILRDRYFSAPPETINEFRVIVGGVIALW